MTGRRGFLRVLAGLAAGLLLRSRRAAAIAAERGTLPPPVVGLRSLGGSFRFDPVGLRLEPGDRLTWLNIGDFHTVTAFHPDNEDLLEGEVPRRIPGGAEPFHSGMLGLDAGSRFEHTFRLPGVYDYFCQPHYAFGMVGRLLVGEGETAVVRAADGLPEPVRANLPSLDAILGRPGRAWGWAARVNGVLLLRTEGAGAAEPAAALRESLLREEEGALPDRADRAALARRLNRFEEAAGGADYEELVRLADSVKEALGADPAGP